MTVIAVSMLMHPSKPLALCLPLSVKPSLPSWPMVWQVRQPCVSNTYWPSSRWLLPSATMRSSAALEGGELCCAKARAPWTTKIMHKDFMPLSLRTSQSRRSPGLQILLHRHLLTAIANNQGLGLGIDLIDQKIVPVVHRQLA